MASAILQNRNGNRPHSTNNTFNFTRFHNFQNPNPNPNPSNFNRYITFRISSFTKREVFELRKRLMSDLERVRILRQWICSKPIPRARVDNSKLVMRKCGQILGKLMQHKHGWVFNKPVDVESLNLYNYYEIVKKPMDLGTIKTKLAKNEYDSPLEFAEDVRLTFENAMLYNGKGSDVFVMAKRLLLLFEDLFGSSYEMFCGSGVKRQKVAKDIVNLVVKKEKKRVMTDDEKTELRLRLWNLQLGDEGVEQIMAILKKGEGLEQKGEDEIELDLSVIDNETLWELHSFIDRNGVTVSSVHNSRGSDCVVNDEKRDDEVEEDIDIGEEMQVTDFPRIEIEKDADASSSGSSSSDSGSSSSDSGSGSSRVNISYGQQEAKSTPMGRGGSRY